MIDFSRWIFSAILFANFNCSQLKDLKFNQNLKSHGQKELALAPVYVENIDPLIS